MVKVNYGALQTMSSTTSSASQGRVAGYQQLISAFSTFSGSDDLQGAGYDAARAYASGIMVSYYQACILYSEAVADAADFLADNYSALCGAESLDEEQLLGEIEGASRLSLQIGASITSLSNQKNRDEGRLSALQTQASKLNDQITKAKEKLENLRKFDSNSASANTEANDAAGRIADAEHTLGVSFAAGTFECTTSTDWADTVATKWEARAVSMQEAYTEALRKFYNGEELTESDLTAIERYHSEYPSAVDQELLQHSKEVRSLKAEEMRYRGIVDKVDNHQNISTEEAKFMDTYHADHPNLLVNNDHVKKYLEDRKGYDSSLENLNNKKKLTQKDVDNIDNFLKNHHNQKLTKAQEDRLIEERYRLVSEKSKKFGQKKYSDKDLAAIKAYIKKHMKDDNKPGLDIDLSKVKDLPSLAVSWSDLQLTVANVVMEAGGTAQTVGKGHFVGDNPLEKMRNFRNAVNNSDAMKVFDGLDDWTKSTSKLGQTANHLGKLGAAGAVLSGASTYLDEKDKYGSKVAAEDAVAHTGIAATSTIVGSVLGTAIPIPGVGTAIGAVAGTYIGNALTKVYDGARHEKVETSDVLSWSNFSPF